MIEKIAVIGADSIVGREIISFLSERKFPVKEVIALDSEESMGKEVSFGFDKKLIINNLNNYDFKGTAIAIIASNIGVSEVYGKKISEKDCVVIDASSFWNSDKRVPVVVAEINSEDVKQYKNKNIVASPNSITIQMLLALKPLHDIAKIKRIIVSTYQSVSKLDREAMDELFNHTKKIYENEFLDPVKFKKQIPFNIIPQIGFPISNGDYSEESEIVNDTRRVFGESVEVSATCVMVPVFASNSQSVNVEFENPITPEKARKILSESESIMVVDRPNDFMFSAPRDIAGEDDIFVSRIRKDFSVKNGLNMWIVADNLRKGSALNAVQIAEILVKNKL